MVSGIASVQTVDERVQALLITGGHFLQIFHLFQGLKIGVPSGCLGETLFFEIINLVVIWF